MKNKKYEHRIIEHTVSLEAEKERKKKLFHRCARIEGQVRGIQKMIDQDIYCDQVLHQIAAAQSALAGLAEQILDNHLRTCVTTRLKNGEDEVIAELLKTLKKLTPHP